MNGHNLCFCSESSTAGSHLAVSSIKVTHVKTTHDNCLRKKNTTKPLFSLFADKEFSFSQCLLLRLNVVSRIFLRSNSGPEIQGGAIRFVKTNMCCYKHYIGHKKFKESASAALLDSERMQSNKKKKVYIMKTFIVELGNRKIDFSAGSRSTMNNSNEKLSFAC